MTVFVMRKSWTLVLLVICAAFTLHAQQTRISLAKQKHPETSPAEGPRKPNIVLMLTESVRGTAEGAAWRVGTTNNGLTAV